MTTIYLAVRCGVDSLETSAHATREQAELEIADWIADYGCGRDALDAASAIRAGEVAYLGGGEYWFEVRALYLEPAPLAGQAGRDTQPAREAIANADAHLNDAGLPTYSDARGIINDLTEYAERQADEDDEPDDGDCRRAIAAARAMLAT